MNRVLICVCLVALFAHASLQSTPSLEGLGQVGAGLGDGKEFKCHALNPLCWHGPPPDVGGAILRDFGSFAAALAKAGIDVNTFFSHGYFGRQENGKIVYVNGSKQVVIPPEMYVKLPILYLPAQYLKSVKSEGFEVIEVQV